MASQERFHSLDAVRALALLLGVALHASMSFIPGMLPGIWATVDAAPSVALGQLFFVTHIFRMSLFFVMAGFFARLLYMRSGARGFWINRLKRIAVPLVVGWCVLFPLYAWVATWGVSDLFGGKVPAAPQQLKPPPGFFPFMHLWFLYVLLLLYPALLVLRRLVLALDHQGALRAALDRVVSLILGTPAVLVVAPALLGAPLALTLYQRHDWLYWAGIPAQDLTYYPQLPAMVGFGTALVVGWVLHRRLELLRNIQKLWLPQLALAIAATLYCVAAAGTSFGFVPAPLGAGKALFAAAYVFAMWSWIFAIMGMGLRFCSGESRVRRYVADSSYWLYLAHLPVVATFDIVVRTWPVHWSVKFAFVLAASFAVLFASYHLLVRPTFIGEWLNGRRYPLRRRKGAAIAAGTLPPPATAPVAQLAAATRRFGTITALDGIDLELRRGELMALLGPNGAGKTSAIALWLGLAEPDAGQAMLLGGSPLAIERRRGVGVMMQDVGLTNGLKVRELIEQTASYYPDPMSVAEVLEITRITDLGGRYYDKLSGGQKRQVQFALAICGRPAVLFLDEPSVGMDIAARETLWSAIRRLRDRGCSILLTTHYLEEAEALADRVVVLSKGRVVASGTVGEVRSIVSRRHIRCDSGLPADELAHWPGVVSVSRAEQRLTILATDAESVLRRLLASDQAVANIEVQQAGLTEAFVELTKEAA
ncbi:MAG TPA: acyltransferase family protein [Steroidobacteraceae bacterium]|nr:acyltransferase family protein [Steroidobacteraceae bacterium]